MQSASFTPDAAVAVVLLRPSAASAVVDEAGRSPPATGLLVMRTDPLGKARVRDAGTVATMAEPQASSSSVVAVVVGGEANGKLVRLLDASSGAPLKDVDFPCRVKALRFSMTRLVVAGDDAALYILDATENFRLMQRLEVPGMLASPGSFAGSAPLALSPSDVNAVVAVPASQPGSVLVYDALRLGSVALIKAHQTSVAALAVSPDGKRLATASQRGTVVRVFVLPSGEQVASFRRGRNPADVTLMAFNFSGSRLVVGSEAGALHVFDVPLSVTATATAAAATAHSAGSGTDAASASSPTAAAGAGAGAASAAGGPSVIRSWLPASLHELLAEERSAYVARLGPSPAPRAVAFSRQGNLRVITADAVMLEFGPLDGSLPLGSELNRLASVDLLKVYSVT